MTDSRGRSSKLTDDKCGSCWFQRCIDGTQVQMGVVWESNTALSLDLLVDVIKEAELLLQNSSYMEEEHQWLSFVTYVPVSYVLSLCGSKGFLLDLKRICANWTRSDGSYFIVALLGKIKGENIYRQHLIPFSHVTSSGIK